MADDTYIRNIVQQEMRKGQQKDQYGVNRTPVHTHNNLDSPAISFGNLQNRQVIVSSHVPGTTAASAGNYGHFYMNPFNYDMLNNAVNGFIGGMTILTITEVHGRAGTDVGTVKIRLALLAPGDASTSGGVTVTEFSLKTTADIPQYAGLLTGATPAVLYPGYRLAIQTTGTLTNVADVLVTVLMQY